MISQKRLLDKVDIPQLKEYIKNVRDPLECPPIPVSVKEAEAVEEYESGFKPVNLRTQARVRQGVNKMIKAIMNEKSGGRPLDQTMKETQYKDDRLLVKYSPMVKMGNWQEQRDVAEEDLNRFLRLRERGQLRIQKTREIFSHTLQPINIPPKKFIQFGDKVQLIAGRARTFVGRGKEEGLALSCVLNGSEAGSLDDTGIEGTILTGSPLIAPCLRNVFELCPMEGDGLDQKGNPARLRYGMEFTLRYLGTQPTTPYYVAVLPNRIIPTGNKSRHPQVHLSSRKSWANAWRAFYVDTERRKETIGNEIPGNSDVIVVSANLNRNLCCETQCWFSTIFGIECEATAFTYLNIYGKEIERNIWYFN